MNGWMTIWTIVFYGVVLCYLGVAIWVVVGGMPELVRMLKSIKTGGTRSEADAPDGE